LTPINIDRIACILLTILSYRRSRCQQTINDQALHELFENIIPYFHTPGMYVYYPPLIQPLRVSHSWRDIFDRSILNRYYGGRLNVDVDSIIGEAIWNRIRRHTGIQNPCPYEFQVEAIVAGLNALDDVRANLRTGNVRNIQLNPNPSIIATLAPTGGGKTEVFEALLLQIALDAHYGNLGIFTKAIIVYPMKAFMIEHFRRFVEDLTYINTHINANISIGILDGDTPDRLSPQGILNRLSNLLGSRLCPLCGQVLRVRGQAPYYIIECNRSHRLNVRIAKDMIFAHPPDILLTTVDSFNHILLQHGRHSLLGDPSSRYVDTNLPPIILALDEPHVYTGVFGSNVSLIIRNFEYAAQEYARRIGLQTYRPLKIVTSATMPHAEEFLARLFVEDPGRIRVIQSQNITSSQNNKGFLMFLPTNEFRFDNAVIEIVPLIAAILPRQYRKILVFVDSVELAERFKRYMEDFIEKGLRDYAGCRHLLQRDVYDPSRGFDPNAIKVAIHTSYIRREDRERIEEGIRRSPPEYNIVIATPTLELGIDIGDITVVVIAGLPPTPEKFAQRAGRAGRRGPGLVVIIGNVSNAVDRYYLTDYNRAIGYLQSSLGAVSRRTYMLPLNPVNLESIRRFLGNIMVTYAHISRISRIRRLQAHNNRILNDLLSLTIDRPASSFSGVRSALLQRVATFALGIRTNLQNQLMQRFNDIISRFGQSYPSRFAAPGFARGRYIAGQINFIPIIDDIRSSTRPVELHYYTRVQPPRQPHQHPYTTKIVNASVALAHYSIKYVEPSTSPYHYFFLDIQASRSRTGQYMPRGTLHYLSIRHGGDMISYLFEVAGLYYSQLDALNNYNAMRQALDEFRRNIEIIGANSLDLDQQISQQLSRTGRHLNVLVRRFYILRESIDQFLNVSNQNDPHIVEPRIFYLLAPGLLGKDNINMLHDMIGARQFLVPLDYFEVEPVTRGNRSWFEFYKISSIRCCHCNSDSVSFVEYDNTNQRLRLRCMQCNRDFLYPYVDHRFVDMIRMYPVTYATTIREDRFTEPIRIGLFTLTFYEDLNVMFGNVGFFTSASTRRRGRRRGRKMRVLARGTNEQYLLNFKYETQGLELRIDWTPLMNNTQILRQIGNEYNSLGIRLPRSFNMWNDFVIRVTHTLSHLLMNFAPIYTGGNRWDVNEYIGFDERNGNITSSSIIIFDSDEGGNGISELIGYFIRDILSDAIAEAARYYLRQRDPLTRFLGEPGITFFGVWPICPYNNIGLSRSLTLYFMQHLLGLSNIRQLTNLTANNLASVIPSL